jgi:hypothetical protein
MSDYPPQVEQLHEAFRILTGVVGVDSGLKALAHFGPETWTFPGEFGDFPHALLRRTNGGLQDEVWAHTEITVSRDEIGWITLEFLAWWVRDQSRSGDQIQMRPMALPPRVIEVQLGTTLKFIIDHFAICPDGDLAPLLKIFESRANFLKTMIRHYKTELGAAAHSIDQD